MAQPNNPKSGRLAEREDFDLDDMLRRTSNQALNITDAWAQGNTDGAFAINNFVGVQRSHRANDWNDGWVDLTTWKPPYSTYVYLPGDPYLIENLTVPKIERQQVATIPVTNTTSEPITTSVTYTETESQTTTITKAWAIGLKIDTKFELFGHTFGFEASFNTSNTEETSKNTTSSTEFTATVAVPANSSYELDVYQEITTQTCLYGLDVAIGSDNPLGSLGKATQNQSTWDRFFLIENILENGGKQQAKYQIDITNVVTKIELKNTAPSGPSPSEAKIISNERRSE
ncbi:hypothetical protein BC937DRAFT_86300 [Endogone sp. FLAS-F59071]|nr:hypothetical protein BC937DRAFT_86300 [Endogone sp. FLAS-F59071]|eukprot:RUS13123.1 hypothetical protein BC937DRAFT_86300 [Endogone sp. FLAS-F59071]